MVRCSGHWAPTRAASTTSTDRARAASRAGRPRRRGRLQSAADRSGSRSRRSSWPIGSTRNARSARSRPHRGDPGLKRSSNRSSKPRDGLSWLGRRHLTPMEPGGRSPPHRRQRAPASPAGARRRSSGRSAHDGSSSTRAAVMASSPARARCGSENSAPEHGETAPSAPGPRPSAENLRARPAERRRCVVPPTHARAGPGSRRRGGSRPARASGPSRAAGSASSCGMSRPDDAKISRGVHRDTRSSMANAGRRSRCW